MKFVQIEYEGKDSYAILESDVIHFIEGTPFTSFRRSPRSIPLRQVRIMVPCRPSKIIAVGVNYKDHALEFHKVLPDQPILFLKPPTAALNPFEAIRLPQASSRVDFEGELAVVIGKKGFEILPEHASDYILGYTCFNDVTARDLQKKDGQWTRAKSYDTFAPFGPCIETEIHPESLLIESYVNGDRRQQASISSLVFDIPNLVSFISNVMTILPGDIIATGTPAGVGPIKSGDTVTISIEGIGDLVNPVA